MTFVVQHSSERTTMDDWIYSKHSWLGEGKVRSLPVTIVENHPLQVTTVDKPTAADPKANKNAKNGGQKSDTKAKQTKLVVTSFDGIDPLSAALSSGSDSQALQYDSEIGERKSSFNKQYLGSDFQDWKHHRSRILTQFSTSERLTLKSSFFHDKNAASILPQKVKNRLEQLDDFDEGSVHEMSNLTQAEYVKKIDELRATMNDAWAQDEKVKALKIAIQFAKQLGATSVIHFYPSKFVLISDILDCFGELVYKRLKNMSLNLERGKDPQQVVETTKNWFYKISSIRELLPRFYIETAVLKIYSFLIDKKDIDKESLLIFSRLSDTLKGVGDPLVATYCRVYLCRSAINFHAEHKEMFVENIRQIFIYVNHLQSTSVQQTLQQQNVDYRLYYTLYTPALDWILNCAFYKANDSILTSVMTMFGNLSKQSIQSGCSALILNSLTTSFPGMFTLKHVLELIEFINNTVQDILIDDGKETLSTSVYPKHVLMRNVALSLNQLEALLEFDAKQKPIVLEQLWNICLELKSRQEYMTCIEPWAEIIAKCYELNDVNELLGRTISRMSTNRDFEAFSNQLLSILSKTVQFSNGRFDNLSFFTISNLLPFLDLFHKEDIRAEASKLLLETLNRSLTEKDVRIDINTELLLLNCGNSLSKTLHDSLNSFTIDDEKRQCSSLIIDFIRRIDFGRDFESQLNFYVDSRANYSSLDSVISFLVTQTNTLAMETHRIVKGNHTKKTISFVSACLAYCFITIPSIEEVSCKLQLYLLSGQVSLINNCLPQTDAMFKSAISLVRQLPPHYEANDGSLHSNDRFLYEFASQLLSTLLVVPDNPDYGYLYLFKGLFNVLKEYRFDNSQNYKFLIWANIIRYLANCTLEEYPYHVNKVDSNDTLYGQEEDFLKEIRSYCEITFRELIDNFKAIPLDDIRRTLCNAISTIELIVQTGRAPFMSQPVEQMWRLIVRIENESRPQEWFQVRKKKTIKTCRKIFEVSA